MAFSLFKHLDKSLVSSESREAKTSRTPSVWPSEASAVRLDKSIRPIDGKCHRQSYFRMTGVPVSNQVDAVGAWRWVTGRMIEDHLTTLAKISDPKLFVASGVRTYIPELFLPLEMDLIVRDPDTNRGWIVECKTYYGYWAAKGIENEGKPKIENLMQAMLYLYQIRTGARLKEMISQSLETRKRLQAAGKTDHRYRTDADLQELMKMDDGPLGAKLAYISRDECNRREFEVGFQQEFDGSFYPTVDGQMWKMWTVESIFDRYRQLQQYWFRARQEAVQRLEAKGVVKPDTLRLVMTPEDGTVEKEYLVLTPEQAKAEDAYLTALEREVRALPVSFWPAAEYEWAYTPEKIEKLRGMGEIGKTAYEDWKKKKPGKDRIGDWQCLYCPYKSACVPHQNPNWKYQLYDIDSMSVVSEK